MRLQQLSSLMRASVAKHGPELRAFLTGSMPPFVLRSGSRASAGGVPVFFFHDIEPSRFEAQLRYLRANGYRTLDADQLEARLRGADGQGDDRAVALTFDDGTWTFWTYAYPLLRRHQARAILFAIAGLVPDDPTVYPTLEDVWQGKSSRTDLARRAGRQPLCTWRELEALHRSGVVDVQSHSLTHALVPVSGTVRGFVHPRFDAGSYGNVELPLASWDDPQRPARQPRLGAPLFEARSRLGGRPRYLEEPELAHSLVEHVAASGGAAFFERGSWRRELTALIDAWPEQRRGGFESEEARRTAIRDELALSKSLLESRLPGKTVRHFCYPWFERCALADQLAAEVGYSTVHGGIDVGRHGATTVPLPVQRISEEYLFRLPGEGRGGIAPVWLNRARAFMMRTRRALS